MANITTLKVSGSTHPTRMMSNVPYVVENYISFADVTAAKGSAIAASDTIEAISVPAGTLILNAGLQCIVPDNATALTLDLGFTGGDVDEFVDGFDHAAAAAGAYSAYLATDPQWIAPTTSADTIDLLIATLTDAPTTGTVRVWALLCDVSEKALKQPSIAQLGS
jgi:hypothetical protein